jgi:predicted transcriptional regulator
VLLENLRNAADGPPLDAESLTSLDRGLADIAAGRVKPTDEYKRERGL